MGGGTLNTFGYPVHIVTVFAEFMIELFFQYVMADYYFSLYICKYILLVAIITLSITEVTVINNTSGHWQYFLTPPH